MKWGRAEEQEEEENEGKAEEAEEEEEEEEEHSWKDFCQTDFTNNSNDETRNKCAAGLTQPFHSSSLFIN
jgi:hypothetical protein